MKKEMLFRAWSEKRKALELVDVIDGKPARKGYQWFLKENDVHNATLEQYVGFCDKNGVKIFEADIVKYIDYILEVKYKNGHYILSLGEGKGLFFFNDMCNGMLEVVGNTHENKNLLEVKQDAK